MADIEYPLSADDGHDDLPRTFRREKEARERERLEQEAKELKRGRGRRGRLDASRDGSPSQAGGSDDTGYDVDPYDLDGPPVPAVVRQFDVSFVRLMLFFMKAALAALPALILLGVVIWIVGEILQQLFPWLVKMQIFVHFPE